MNRMSIAQFAAAGKMTETEYRARREEIRATYGDSASERAGLFEQELARLFYQSGWTQEQLAAIESKSRKWIDFRVRFGRFLDFGTTVPIPKNLTEGRFRGYWERTDRKEGNERIRFRDVARLMDEETTLSKPHRQKRAIGEAIKATSAGGWHRLATITTHVQAVVKEATEEDVEAVLKGMVQHGWYNVFCEKKKGGDIYRIVIGGKQKIDLVTLKQELGPILEGLKAEGRKNMALMSPGTVARLAFQLEQLIDKLAHLAPKTNGAQE
jgi:hypothetical protein